MDLHNHFQEISPEETQKKIESTFIKMAAFFPDSHKAEECLFKLNQIKDNSMFKLLEELLEEQAFTMTGKTMKVCFLLQLMHTRILFFNVCVPVYMEVLTLLSVLN